MRLTTDRLILRRFRPNDAADLYDYLSNPDCVKFEPYEVFNKRQAKAEAVNRANSKSYWAVEHKETHKVIGNLYFNECEFYTWELGYVFHPDYQHKGYAYEATHALMKVAFTRGNAHRVIALCCTKNFPSWHLMERLGMRREGFFSQNLAFKHDSKGHPIWFDSYQYAILRDEFIENETSKN